MKILAHGHTPRLVVLGLCATMLFACVATGDSKTDLAGNVYPPECTVNAATTEPAQRIAVAPRLLTGFPKHHFDDRVLGVTFTAPNRLPVIWYDETLTGWALIDVERHEGCHALKYRLKGNAQWHG